MILVTGSSGFIGSRLLQVFGDEAIGIQRSKGADNTISFELSATKSASALIDEVRAVGTIDCVVHAAGVTPWAENPDFTLDLKMAHVLAELCNKLRIPKLIFLSGWNVYDSKATVPYTESTPLAPVTEYGRSKKSVEEYFMQSLKNTTPVYLRLSSVYGPGQVSPGLLTNLVKTSFASGKLILGSENTKRDYLYIDDLVEVVLAVLGRHFSAPQTFNVGGGSSVSVREIAEIIRKICQQNYGVDVDITVAPDAQDATPIDNQLDISMLQSEGVLSNPTAFEEGIKNYIEWYKHENIL